MGRLLWNWLMSFADSPYEPATVSECQQIVRVHAIGGYALCNTVSGKKPADMRVSKMEHRFS
jgi:hypothetical protein